jgi:uncharacterized protein YciI
VALFVLIGRDGPQGLALRRQHREAHLANLKPLADAGRVAYAGPLLDAGEQPCGSVVVFEADDLDAAERFAATDPYVVKGIFATWDVFASKQVFPDPSTP